MNKLFSFVTDMKIDDMDDLKYYQDLLLDFKKDEKHTPGMQLDESASVSLSYPMADDVSTRVAPPFLSIDNVTGEQARAIYKYFGELS